MSLISTNDTEIRVVELAASSTYILGLENEETRNDVYKRYLKNLNYSASTNISIRNFAKMFFSDNSSAYNATLHQLSDDVVPKPFNNKFSVANSEAVLILLTVIYVIIFITGVLGNVVTCIVIAKNKGMHTAVNYYLFSLAVSDLLLLISALPDEVYMLWFREYPFDETACKVHKFFAESFTNATVLTITAFTIERYVAICKPFLSHTMSKLSRAYKFILVIWLISICLAVPQTLFTLHLDETYLICVPKQDYNHLFVVSTFLLFVIPMSIISILYVLIGLQLRKSKIVQRGAVNGSSVRLKRKIFKKATNQTLVTINCESHYSDSLMQLSSDANKNHFIDHEAIIPEDGRINYSNRGPIHGSRHVVNMLVVVVIAFFLCWCPFHIQRIVFTYIEHSAIDENLSFSINYISGVLFFVSTCINPFLYNIMSNKFREAFKVTISSYFSRSTEKDVFANDKLFRTTSQRSYSCSVNSTSLNTCSSVCSMQPFGHSQQLPFRYFDSDMAKKRPLVVSFRRIQKMTPSHSDKCDSVSICDIHRLDTKARDNNELMTMKIVSKHGSNPSRMAMQRRTTCNENQSCRNFSSSDKQKLQLESLYDRNVCDPITSDKSIVYPKEKFYGNAKILLTMNNDVLRKDIIDCDDDSFDRPCDNELTRWNVSQRHHLTKDRCGRTFKTKEGKSQVKYNDSQMIDGFVKADERQSNFLSTNWDAHSNLYKTNRNKQQRTSNAENETRKLTWKSIPKSSSTTMIYHLKKLSTGKDKSFGPKAPSKPNKSVSLLSITGK